ncbi:hypothetical protein JCM8202_002443 [Rhodotorula sphaerocarpa]
MASLLQKFKGAVNPVHNDAGSERGRSYTPAHHSHLNPDHTDEVRSLSRGRDTGITPTGRGGRGNMSRSRVRDGAEPSESPEDVAAARSRSRSRARAHHHGQDLPVAHGRGGAGNVAADKRDAASRERERKIEEEDAEAEARFAAQHRSDEFLTGRGGLGNKDKEHVVH